MRSAFVFALVAALTAFLIPSPLAGQHGRHTAECCLVLLLPVGARAAAMGRAMTAWGSPDAVFTNPAGLATLDRAEFLIHHEPLMDDQQANAFSVLLTPRTVGTLGLTYQLIDYGSEEARDEFGVVTGRLSTREHLLVASFATVVRGGLTAGINYKLYTYRLGCEGYCLGMDFTGTTHALDAGFRARVPGTRHLIVGGAVVNLGFALQVVNAPQADPMPVRVRGGAAYEVLHHFVADTTVSVWVTAEVEDRLRNPGAPQAAIGAEVTAAGAFYLWSGYRTGEGRGTGAALGFGLRYDRYFVGISRSFASTPLQLDHEPIQITLGVRF